MKARTWAQGCPRREQQRTGGDSGYERVGGGCPTTLLPCPCRMDLPHLTNPTDLPKHILDIWVIVLIILATILIMTALVLCPATAVIIYRVRTHPTRNGIV
ncbi:small integral membrane protein 3-like [Cinclus cinclus]